MEERVQVCVFAYNLESDIETNLKSLIESCDDYQVDIYVMINGCKDNTFSRVKHITKQYPFIFPVKIPLGDKSNAWNTFVYEYYKQGAIAVFADGDLTFANRAVANIVDYYRQHNQYNSVSSFPCEFGRSSKAWRKALLNEHQFTGNLYLLSPKFLAEIKEKQVRLPVGLIGDDSMLGYLSATSLCSGSDIPKERIGVCESAVFNYEPLNPWSIKDLRLYLRRRVRYSKRHFQQNDIVPKLKSCGINAMPDNAWHVEHCKIRWFSQHCLFDIIASRMLQKQLR